MNKKQEEKYMLEIGTKVPAFELPDQNGHIHTLEEYKGKKVILYFYPKDNTHKAGLRFWGTLSSVSGKRCGSDRGQQGQRSFP